MKPKRILKLALFVIAMALTFAAGAVNVAVADGGPIWVCLPGPKCVQPPSVKR